MAQKIKSRIHEHFADASHVKANVANCVLGWKELIQVLQQLHKLLLDDALVFLLLVFLTHNTANHKIKVI